VVVVVVLTMGGGDDEPATTGGGDTTTTGGQPAEATRRPDLPPTATPAAQTWVIVSAANLPRGWVIQPDDLDVELWPISRAIQESAYLVPEQYYADDNLISDAEKAALFASDASPTYQRTRQEIPRWQPVLQSMVSANLWEGSPNSAYEAYGSHTSAILPQGYVAMTIPIDILAGVGYAIGDGDRVDVIGSFLYVDVDEEFQSIEPLKISLVTITAEGGITIQEGIEGRLEQGSALGQPVLLGPLEDQRPRLVTQRTIQNALVIHVGEFEPETGQFLGEPEAAPTEAVVVVASSEDPTGGGSGEAAPLPTPEPPRPSIITLGVTPQEAVALAWLVEAQVPYTLTIRSAEDREALEEGTDSVTLEYMAQRYEIERPPKLEYALEPRITEIRSINALLRDESLISFIDATSGRRGSGASSGGQ
jgi:Flp pilus assembly protein CpaB